jgi:hypothetical protein
VTPPVISLLKKPIRTKKSALPPIGSKGRFHAGFSCRETRSVTTDRGIDRGIDLGIDLPIEGRLPDDGGPKS